MGVKEFLLKPGRGMGHCYTMGANATASLSAFPKSKIKNTIRFTTHFWIYGQINGIETS